MIEWCLNCPYADKASGTNFCPLIDGSCYRMSKRIENPDRMRIRTTQGWKMYQALKAKEQKDEEELRKRMEHSH